MSVWTGAVSVNYHGFIEGKESRVKGAKYFTVAGSLAGAGVGTGGLTLALSGTPMVLAATSTAVLGVAAVSAATVGAVQWFRARPPGSQYRPHEVYSSRWAASDADVADAYEFFVAQLTSADEVSLESMRVLHAKNPKTLRLIERQRGSQTRLMGMVLLTPLTPSAENRIRTHQMRDSFDADVTRDAAKSWSAIAAYIGGIAGSTERGRAHALGFCEAFLGQHRIARVYARPISTDGERVMRRWGFHPLPHPSRFWVWVSMASGTSLWAVT